MQVPFVFWQQAGLLQQMLRCCDEAWTENYLETILAMWEVNNLVLAPTSERATQALHFLFHDLCTFVTFPRFHGHHAGRTKRISHARCG